MKLQDQIGRNEKIVWSGKKDKRVSIFESIFNSMLPFALIWGIFDFGFIGSIFKSGAKVELDGFNSFLIMFFAVHLMPVWIYLAGILTASLKAKNTEYLITDKGIYIQTGIFTTNVELKPFTDLSHISVRQGFFDKIFGTGDVVTVCEHMSTTSYSNHRGHSHGMNIENIPDYIQVFKMVKDMQESIYSDTMYPNKFRPTENYGYNTTYVRDDNWR